MVIVFVVDNFLSKTDGTHISANRFREELIKRGHTVRVVSIGVTGEDMYGLKEHWVPIVTYVAKKNSIRFAKFDRKVVQEAFTGADIVHLFFPWQVHQKCLELAKEMKIPVSAAFHCQPENVTYNAKIKLLGFVASFLYEMFKFWLYRKVDNIHCPSTFIADELKRHRYAARLHIISNGVCDIFTPPESEPERNDDIINVLMIGRLAEEKRQDLIIKAVKCSKYRDRIQLYFAGKGPMEPRYVRQSQGLRHPPRFEFLPQDQLLELIYKVDIYIHASDAEIEGISCIEGFACGKVPIISNSKKSATSQFALDERCLFKKGNYRDLRDKLDYWIEHPEERKEMGKKYADLGKKYNISHSVIKMEALFKDAILDYKTKNLLQDNPQAKTYYRKVQRSPLIKRFAGVLLYYLIAFPILALVNTCFFGLKIKNKKAFRKLKDTGVVTICNHIHEMDSVFSALSFFPRKPIFISLPSNFSLGVAGFFVHMLGAIPAPGTLQEIRIFIYALSKRLRSGRVAHFYPEGELVKYDSNLREFKRGAFYLAIDARVPVLPIKISYRPPAGLFKLFRKEKPCLTLTFGDPLYPNYTLHKNEAIADLQKRAEESMGLLG